MPPAPQGGQQNDNHMAALWISFTAFVVLVLLWALFHKQVTYGLLQFKAAELWLIAWFVPSAAALRQQLLFASRQQVSVEQLFHLAAQAGSYFLIPVIVILLFLAWLLFKRSVGSRFKTLHTMKTLWAQELKNWPQTAPAFKADLANVDINEGPWAMALRPLDFAKKHGLLKLQRKRLEEGMLKKDAKIEATLIKVKASQLFVKQMGAQWRSVEALPMHCKALLAVCATRIAGDAQPAHDLLMRIARSSRGGKLDFSGTRELLAKHGNNRIVLQTIERHAYVLTVMASLLQLARATGVLATADFLWLKLVDRRLWYMLSSVGRQVPFVESAGPYSHWQYEKALERAFRTPMIENATAGLERAIKDQMYTEDE